MFRVSLLWFLQLFQGLALKILNYCNKFTSKELNKKHNNSQKYNHNTHKHIELFIPSSSM